MLFYKKITILIFLIFFFTFNALANMAAPWIEGTNNREAYLSKKINILHEQINISIIDLHTANFDIVYTIKPDISGKQIPIIFDDYQDYDRKAPLSTFNAWLDGKTVSIANISTIYDDSTQVQFIEELRKDHLYQISKLNAFKYFEVDLNKDSTHQIRVNYTAQATILLHGFVRKYEFRYNLRPAKFWKNFEELDITIDASKAELKYFSDLSDGSFSGIQKWHFEKAIPQDEFSITLIPEISKTAQFFIALDPMGIASITTLLFILLHIYFIYTYRKKQPLKKFSAIAIIGSIVVPLVFCIMFLFGYSFIDWLIGEHASRMHGYIFLIFFTYPFLFIIYLTISLIVDYILRKHIQKKRASN